MPDLSLVDKWLMSWDEQRRRGTGVSLDEFVRSHCPGGNSQQINEFRAKASDLRRIDSALRDSRVGTAGRSRSPLVPGAEPIPGYRIVSRLGDGGFGEVWKATAPGGFPVALKFIASAHGARGDRELKALKMIKEVRHPHLLAIVGAWQSSGYLIIAMELAEGTLEQRLDQAGRQGHSGIPRDELLGYMTEAAQALDYLHQSHTMPAGGRPIKNIQHLDIKPQNLLLSGGSIKVADYGLAQCLENSITSLKGGATWAYAAPEVFEGKASTQSDQYSLAATYCVLRTGLVKGNRAEEKKSKLPAEERRIVERALAKLPRERWPSCTDFVAALRETASGQVTRSTTSSRATKSSHPRGGAVLPVQAMPPAAAPLRSQRRRSRARIGAVLLVVFSLAALALWATIGRRINEPGDSAHLTDVVTLAVLDFENHSKDSALDGFRLGMRDMLVTDLARVAKIRIVERSRMASVLEEHKLAQGGFIDAATAARLGKGLAARSLLTGSFVISGDEVRVDVRLISVETGEIELAEKVSGTKTEFFRLEQTLADKVLVALKVQPSESERQALSKPQTRDFEAYRLYSHALLAQQQGRQNEAEASLRQALVRDPQFQAARSQLADIEAAILDRLATASRERAEKLGTVGKALSKHLSENQATVDARKYDAAYFSSLLLLSAHAGILGNIEQEQKLLVRFWIEFSAHVPPDRMQPYAQDIRMIITREGRFFQELLDSGEYCLFAEW